MKKTYAAQLDKLSEIAEDIESFGRSNRVPERDVFALNLAADELFTNAVQHGYKMDSANGVEIEILRNGDEVVMTVSDSAPQFNPLEMGVPRSLSSGVEEREVGGLGIFFVVKKMDSVSYRYADGKNKLTMVKKLNGSR